MGVAIPMELLCPLFGLEVTSQMKHTFWISKQLTCDRATPHISPCTQIGALRHQCLISKSRSSMITGVISGLHVSRRSFAPLYNAPPGSPAGIKGKSRRRGPMIM